MSLDAQEGNFRTTNPFTSLTEQLVQVWAMQDLKNPYHYIQNHLDRDRKYSATSIEREA